MISRTLLKTFEASNLKEIEGAANTWIKDSGEVYAVVNMRVYPPGDTHANWCCYVIYKEKFKEAVVN